MSKIKNMIDAAKEKLNGSSEGQASLVQENAGASASNLDKLDSSLSASYEFEFKLIDGQKEVAKKFYGGKGTEAEAIAQARKLADEESAGRSTVVFTGNFKKL